VLTGGSATKTAAGTYAVTADFVPNDSNYNTLTGLSAGNFVIGKANQTITFGALSNKTYGDSDFTVSATASSGLAVTFSIASGPATISGNTVHLTGVGTVIVRASQGGDSNWNPASDVDQSFDVTAGADQVLVTVELQGYLGPQPASFTFVATGGVTKQYGPESIAFDGATQRFQFLLTEVPSGTTHISAKADGYLRRKLGGTPGATVNFSGTAKLLGGDLNDDNKVNAADYATLRAGWNTPAGDIDGDGNTGSSDYTLLKGNWYAEGDAE
jgi:hypothetical protein